MILLDDVGPSDDDNNAPDITIQDVAEVRELEALEDITYRYMTEEELKETMGDLLDQEALNESARVLYSVFLIDSIEELGPAYAEALSEQVLGYYDSESKEMVIIDTGSSSAFDTRIPFSRHSSYNEEYSSLTTFSLFRSVPTVISYSISVVNNFANSPDVRYLGIFFLHSLPSSSVNA